MKEYEVLNKYCIRKIQELLTDIEELKEENYHIKAHKKYTELVIFLRGVEAALFDKGFTVSAKKYVDDDENKSKVSVMIERYKDPEKWYVGKEIVYQIDSDWIVFF